MQDQTGMGSRMLDILLEGVSMRLYGAVIPKMADTVGVSKSSVSRRQSVSDCTQKDVAEIRLRAISGCAVMPETKETSEYWISLADSISFS